MFSLTMPNLAALALALLQLLLFSVVCWGRPQRLAQQLRGKLLFVVLAGTLAGLVVLIDYGEWKEGYATRGQLRRSISIDSYTVFAEQQQVASVTEDCSVLLAVARKRYEQMSAELVRWSGSELPAISATDLGSGNPRERLLEFLWRSRLNALQAELEHDFSRGVGTYFSDRLFDGD